MRTSVKKAFIIITALYIAFAVFTPPCFTLSDAQSVAIKTLLDDACRKSGVPGMSVSIVDEDETYYFSSGYANREEALPASEDALYELGSVSKAFTGIGILLLEEQGLLSMNDPVVKYLPWFTLKYRGARVDMQGVTLNNFLYHTSGLVNFNHFLKIPQGNTQDMLKETVEIFVDAELAFLPGERYEYGTMNYDVLGLVIEVVSGQSYEAFMTEQVFRPLGLDNTFLYKEDAQATGHMTQGYRSCFLITLPYDDPDYAGNKPAGYVISSARDMARWMGIQIGIIDDIPDIFREVVRKSHMGNKTVQDVRGMYYAAGWEVNADQTLIEHGGGNPAYRTYVLLFPEEKVAICLLTNGSNTNNRDLAKSIKEIIDGNFPQSYRIDLSHILNILLSIATIVSVLFAVILFILGLRSNRMKDLQTASKKRRRKTIIWLSITIALCVMYVLYSALFRDTWANMLVWIPYSLLPFMISLPLLTTSATWFVYTRHHIHIHKNKHRSIIK